MLALPTWRARTAVVFGAALSVLLVAFSRMSLGVYDFCNVVPHRRDAENKRSILDVAPWGGRERACCAVSSADSFVSNLASRCSKEQSHTQEEERRSDHEPRTPRIGAGKMPDAAQAGSIATPVGGLACGALRPAVLMVYDTASMNVPISTIGVDNAAKRSILRGKKRAKNIMGELPGT